MPSPRGSRWRGVPGLLGLAAVLLGAAWWCGGVSLAPGLRREGEPPPTKRPVARAARVPTEAPSLGRMPWSYPSDSAEQLAEAQRRADWIGGATVVCALPSEPGYKPWTAHTWSSNFSLEATHNKFMHRVFDHEIYRVTEQEAGEATLLVRMTEPDEVDSSTSRLVRMRWSGATPGATVRCDSIAFVHAGEVVISLQGDPPASNPSDDGSTLQLQGCGLMDRWDGQPKTVPIEPGACDLWLFRRGAMPFQRTQSGPYRFEVTAGGLTQVEAAEPPPVTAFTPLHDLHLLAYIADDLAYLGHDAATDLLEDALQAALDGAPPEEVHGILDAARDEIRSRPDPDPPLGQPPPPR